MKNIKYPEMREELLSHLKALSDVGYQRRVWIEKIKEGAIQNDEFDYVVHFLYDDTQLADNPRSMVGWILEKELEADLIEKLVAAIEGIFQKYGTGLTDVQYIELAEWGDVVDAAKAALAVISK